MNEIKVLQLPLTLPSSPPSLTSLPSFPPLLALPSTPIATKILKYKKKVDVASGAPARPRPVVFKLSTRLFGQLKRINNERYQNSCAILPVNDSFSQEMGGNAQIVKLLKKTPSKEPTRTVDAVKSNKQPTVHIKRWTTIENKRVVKYRKNSKIVKRKICHKRNKCTVTLKLAQESDNSSLYDCNICFTPATNAVIGMCGHLFCWPCLNQWLISRPIRQLCPVCKALISRDNIIPIYGRNSIQVTPYPDMSPRPAGRRIEAPPEILDNLPFVFFFVFMTFFFVNGNSILSQIHEFITYLISPYHAETVYILINIIFMIGVAFFLRLLSYI